MKKKKKYRDLESRVTEETKAMVQKQREKFIYGKDEPGTANNFDGVLIRTTGRKLVTWRNNN